MWLWHPHSEARRERPTVSSGEVSRGTGGRSGDHAISGEMPGDLAVAHVRRDGFGGTKRPIRPEVRDYQRMLASGAADDTPPDKQGRITIPPHLRTYAGLDKDCVVVGPWTEWRSGTPGLEDYPQRKSAFAELDETASPIM